MTVSLADAVELAADTIAEHPDRWIQGTYFQWQLPGAPPPETGDRSPTCACALGQIDLAAEAIGYWHESLWPSTAGGDLVTISGDLDLLDHIVIDLTGSNGMADHNDAEGRTPQQMAGLLREVADTLRAESGAKQTTNNPKEK